MRLLNLKAIPHPDGNRIDLYWVNPDPVNYPGIRIVRRLGTHPISPEDGVIVTDGDDDLDFTTNAQGERHYRIKDSPLKGETVYYYAWFPYPDEPPVYAIDPANRAIAMVTSPYGMAGQMAELLPAIYHRYDASLAQAGDAEGKPGPLRRFLDLPGGQLDQLYSYARALLDLYDPGRVDGRLLPLLAQWIGWRTDFRRDFQAQRNELRQAPYIQDTVGTLPNIEATVKRLIGWDCRAKEFVDNIFVTNQPQRLNLWVMRLNGQAEPDPAELLSLDFAYEGRPSAIVSDDIGGSTRRWLFYHSPLSSGVESTVTNSRRDNPTLGALASSPASGRQRQSTASKIPVLSGNSRCGQPAKRPGLSGGPESTCYLPPQSGWTILYKTMLSFRISKEKFAPVLGQNSISTALLQQFADHGLALSYDLALEAMEAAKGGGQTKHGSWIITDNQRHAKYKVEEQGEDLVVSTEWSGGLPLPQGQDKRWRRHPSAVTFAGVPLVFWDVYDDSATARWFIEASKYENGVWTPPWRVFDDSQKSTDRRSPHAVVHDGNLWLFWQERLETGWRLRYLKASTFAGMEQQTHEDFPDIKPGQPVDPGVEDDFFAVSDPVNQQWLRFFWAGREGSEPSGQPSHQTRWHLFQRIHDGTNWGDVKSIPSGGDADDRDPMAMEVDGKLELWWSSNRDGSWSIWCSELDRDTDVWKPAHRITSGLYDQRTPLLFSDGEETLLFYRSTEAIIRTSSTDSATYTLDTRYSGCTTVNTLNQQRIGAFKMFEDFTSYTYDTGPQGKPDNTTWYSPNTVGIYLRVKTGDVAQIETKRQLATEFLQAFLPIQVRLVFIIEPPIFLEEVYSEAGPLAEETWFILREGASDEVYPGPVEDEKVNKSSIHGWTWLLSWKPNPPQPLPVTSNPDFPTRFRTWHIDVTVVE